LKEAEESWEENVLSEEIEDRISEMVIELEEISGDLNSLKRRMEKLEDENKSI
jgi:polyhydroxyalkanoate synthesis regulator phasin